MAADMIKYCSSLLLALLCALSVFAYGEDLQDPTRPPAGINDGGLITGQMIYPQVRGLQSVIISPSHCSAIIDGKTVALGARHGSEVLVEVGEYGVVMLGMNGRRRALRLFPAVGMKITEALPLDKQAVTCKSEQNNAVKKPAKETGKKETR